MGKAYKYVFEGSLMADKVGTGDFVEVEYSGKVDDSFFDTTSEKVARENGLFSEKNVYTPAKICVGEKQILPGLDSELVGKEIGKNYSIVLPMEKAFGKRDIKKMRIVPMNTFKEHKVAPQPGLQIDVDGERGTVTRVSGGRVIVNFNHPLAGKEITYDVKINKKITDRNEQVKAFLNTALKIPMNQIEVESNEKKLLVKMPVALPEQFMEALSKKLADLVGFPIEFKNSKDKASVE
jgi:FKBP-type peptidyl-prolyl cis-trans isomerase 2